MKKRYSKPRPIKKKIQECQSPAIQDFLRLLFFLHGFKRGKDYLIRGDHLYFIKDPQRRKIISVLKEAYPQYNYCWESSRVLIWF